MKAININANRQMKRLLIMPLLMTFSFATNSQAKSIQTCDAPVSISKQGVTTKLLQGGKKHRYLEVDINGTLARAVVDTGGMGIGGLISEDLLPSVGIAQQELEEMTANGAHGASSAKRLNMNKTSINGASVDNLMFMTTKNNVMQDDAAPVLIGSRFLCQFLVEFNFSKNRLSFYDRSTNVRQLIGKSNKWVSLPFENFYNTGGIVFEMELNGKKIKAALDTGSSFSGINWKAAKLAGIDKNSKKLRQYESVAHSLNATASTTVHESEFTLSLSNGKLSRNDKEVRINDIHSFKQLFGDNPGMILGLPYFEKRRLVIDYKNNRLYIAEG